MHPGTSRIHDIPCLATRREHAQQVRTAAENYRKAESKRAWELALKFIDVDFKAWLKTTEPDGQYDFYILNWAMAKAFDLSDVEWNDARNVTVHGLLILHSGAVFSWTRKGDLQSNGVDNNLWHLDDPVFAFHAKLTDEQSKHLSVNTIVGPGGDGERSAWTSPLIR